MANKKTETRRKALRRRFTKEGYHVNTPQVREEFLTHVRNGASLQLAADLCGHSRSTFRKIAEADPEFAEALEEAREGRFDRVDDEVWRRGVRGVRKAVYHQGKIIAFERVYSDRMLELMAKQSGRYANASDGAQVQVNVQNNTLIKMNDEELLEAMRARGLPVAMLEE